MSQNGEQSPPDVKFTNAFLDGGLFGVTLLLGKEAERTLTDTLPELIIDDPDHKQPFENKA